jgi:hypothetical protein
VIDEVAKEQRHERKKVSGLQGAMGKVRRQIEGVMIKSSETEEAVERGLVRWSGRRWDWPRRRIGHLRSNQMSQVCGQR